MIKAVVLVIEDDETVRDVLGSFLTSKNFEVTLAANGEEGRDLLRSKKFDLVLTDLIMPGIGGMDILREATAAKLTVPVIVLTAFGTVQTAVEAIRMGAFDYITKPFNPEELLIVIDKALSVQKLQKENIMLKMQLRKKFGLTGLKGLIGQSTSMQDVYGVIEKIADTDSTVLIMGESGTGKELIAKTIHFNSSRAAQPFIPLNCAAIPKDLLESELFGHEKGAFTGAAGTRIGRFELAQNGTLFLDEVGELDPSLQVKLLRVLQEREFERVGGMKTIKVDVRILAATNRDLELCVAEGRFREDLFYRLNVIPIHLPALRSRLDDIPLLIDYFVHIFAKKRKREPFTFSAEAMQCLNRYNWPGNVRELENLIERLSILVSGNEVRPADLPDKIRQKFGASVSELPSLAVVAASPNTAVAAQEPDPAWLQNVADFPHDGVQLNEMVSTMERNMIMRALEKSGGVRSKAAQLLGLNRTTLLEKMKKMGIEVPKK